MYHDGARADYSGKGGNSLVLKSICGSHGADLQAQE